MPALAPQVGVPVNSRRIAANDALNVPEKVQDFAQNFKAVAMNHPYFRRTWGESAKDAAISFGTLARNAIVNRYGTQDAEGRSHFLDMTSRETPGVFQILKRFATRTPIVVEPKQDDEDKATDKDKKSEAKKVESRSATEEVNQENMRLVQAQVDALKSIDANVKTILQTIVELKKADDQKGLQNNVEANNAQNQSLFPSLFDFLNIRRTPKTTVPKTTVLQTRRNVFSRVMNASKALVTRASATFSPLATKVSAPITKAVSAVREANITNKLTKGIDLAKNSATQGAKTFTQNSLKPALGNLAEKAKTGSAQLLDVAKKGGSRGVELAKSANQSILKMMPKGLVNKLPVVGAVAGGALAIADYNTQAAEIDKQVEAGLLNKSEAETLKSNLVKKGAGSTIGAGIGTAIGSTIGSIIPGAGTLVGGLVGGWLGEKVGSWVGESMGDDPEVAKLQARIDKLNALAEVGNLHWTNVRAIRKDVQTANIDQDDKNDLLEQLDELDKDAIKKGDARTRAVLARTSTGQAALAQAAPTNQALTPNGAQSYASAFDAKVDSPKVENSGNTTVTQVNNNSTNNTISSFGLTTRNGDDSLRNYRQANLATVG